MFHYLKGIQEHMLTIGKSGTLPWNNKEHTGLKGYCDANWALQEHQHTMSGYIFMIDGSAVSWGLKRQSPIALSTMEAEDIVLHMP